MSSCFSGAMEAHETSNLRVAGSSPVWSAFFWLCLGFCLGFAYAFAWDLRSAKKVKSGHAGARTRDLGVISTTRYHLRHATNSRYCLKSTTSLLYINPSFEVVNAKISGHSNARARDRTWNLQINSLARYQLRHTSECHCCLESQSLAYKELLRGSKVDSFRNLVSTKKSSKRDLNSRSYHY